eukprot:2945892-Pyramimonas_sp.AAC.1
MASKAAPAASEKAHPRDSAQASRCWIGASDRRRVLIASIPQPRWALKWQELVGLMIDGGHAPRNAPRAQGSEVVDWGIGLTSGEPT